MKADLTFEKLSFLTTEELWKLMRDLKVPYCTIKDVEKENLETKEKVTVPCFIPRTDYEDMKSDIIVAYSQLNNKQRRFLCAQWNGIITKREKEFKKGEMNE